MESFNHQHHINVGNEEESAAIVMAAMGNSGKRKMDHPDAAAGGAGPPAYRFSRPEEEFDLDAFEPIPWRELENQNVQQEQPIEVNDNFAGSDAADQVALKPYPYFFYVDYSTEPDKDNLTPLTPPGRVPNFPSKMHAMLAREDLKSMICWLPHGRAWKVNDSKEFEKKVLPIYFEHAKYSSFIRQANGWGFRRVTTGHDRGAYYHPRFLRGLPHLCKDMKRPGVSKKLAADVEHEPDLERISQEHPVPTNAVPDESVLLHCTVQNGPKARMPIYSGTFLNKPKFNDAPSSLTLYPTDQEFLSAFQHSLGASEHQLQNTSAPAAAGAASSGHVPLPISFANPIQQNSQAASVLHLSQSLPATSPTEQVQAPKTSPLSEANELAFSNAAAQFAAGFAAAMGMFSPQPGMGLPMFGAMMTNNNMLATAAAAPSIGEAHAAAAAPITEAPGSLSSSHYHHEGELVPLAPMPPMQHAPAPLPTNVTLLSGTDTQHSQFFPVGPPVLPTNDLKPPPT